MIECYQNVLFMFRTIHVFYIGLCLQYMGSPYKRSISPLGTTRHTIQCFSYVVI